MSRPVGVILTVVRALLGGFFIFSAFTKLNPIEYFEFQLVNDHLATWAFSGLMARSLIAIEFFLGICLVLSFDYKKIITKGALLMMIFFTIYLLIVLIFRGNEDNCNCFGEFLKVSVVESLVKNIILIGVIVLLLVYNKTYSYRYPIIISSIILVGSISSIFIINPLNKEFVSANDLKKVDYKVDLSFLYTDSLYQKPQVDLTRGKHVLFCFSMSCPHCRLCAIKIGIMKKQNPELPFYVFLNGDKVKINPFIKDTKMDLIDYNLVLGQRFISISGFNLPTVLFIDNSTVKKKIHYPDLTNDMVMDWVNHK